MRLDKQEAMSKYQSKIEKFIKLLIQFPVFERFFHWMASSKDNEHRFILYFNIFNTSLYLTASISPWIFIYWGLILPLLLFRASPVAGISNLLDLVRKKKVNFTGFVITVFFMMLFYICLFACFFMLFGTVVQNGEVPIEGLWSHFYFSAVTFTTLGYGNIVPSTVTGEVIATIEVIIGFCFFALLIGVASALALENDD
tara:strand:- start:119 stop:715 length:597 start_codon:yes stop_codon:yes gene_type:complete